MPELSIICLDTNALWDLAVQAKRHHGSYDFEEGIKYSLRSFSRLLIELRAAKLIRVVAPWFVVAEYRNLSRDDQFCDYQLRRKGRSPMHLRKHRPDYLQMPPVHRNQAAVATEDALRELHWIKAEERLSRPDEFCQLMTDILSQGALSLDDSLVFASSIDQDVSVFVSNDGVFGNEEVQAELRAITKRGGLAFFDHRRFEPLYSSTGAPGKPVQKRQRKRPARREFVGALFQQEIEGLLSQRLGVANDFIEDGLGVGLHLLKYRHQSSSHAVEEGALIALVGESYSRKLLVRSVEEHDAKVSGPVSREVDGKERELGLAVESVDQSFLDPEIRGRGDWVCLESQSSSSTAES